MSEAETPRAGSRYLYESFDAAAARMEANERIVQLQLATLEQRLDRIEMLMERLEKRLWLTVYSVVGVILAQGVAALIETAPK